MGKPENAIYQLLSTDGHGGGTTSWVGAANTYKILAPPDTELVLVRLNVYLEDNGQFRGDRYGSTAALSTGITIKIFDTDGTTVLQNFTNGFAIKKIGHWALLSGVDVEGTNYTTGNNTWLVRWTLAKAGQEISLFPGQSFQVIVADNLAGGGADLVEHFGQMQGSKNILTS
jgi:hypothetical protein